MCVYIYIYMEKFKLPWAGHRETDYIKKKY